MHRAFSKFTTFLFGLALAFVLAEAILRAFWHPFYLNEKYKRDDIKWLKENVVLNRFGYRDRHFSFRKEARVFRIYALGDSYTYGWYIDDPFLTYPKVLEGILQAKYGQDRVEVINAARPGFSLKDEVNRFENEGMLFSPDLVTVGVNIFDLLGCEFAPSFTKSPFLRKLRLYQLTFGNRQRAKVSKKMEKEIQAAYQDESPQMKEAERLFVNLKDLTDSIGVELVIIVFPAYNPADPNEEYRYINYNEQLAKIGERHSIRMIDLLEPFDKHESKKDLVLNPLDPHPSVLANNIAAQNIFEKLDFDAKLARGPVQLPIHEAVVKQDSILPDFKGILSMKPSDWVFFDRKFDLDIQKGFLPKSTDKRMAYLEDFLKTAKVFTHDGWPGAKIEYYVPTEKGEKLKIPRELYGYKVVGVSQITGFWRHSGALNSEDLNLDEVTIWRDKKNINIEVSDKERFEYYRLVVDIKVKQIDIDDGRVVDISATEILKGFVDRDQRVVSLSSEGKLGSLPKYVWLNDEMVGAKISKSGSMLEVYLSSPASKSLVIEIPVAKKAKFLAPEYLMVEYIRL